MQLNNRMCSYELRPCAVFRHTVTQIHLMSCANQSKNANIPLKDTWLMCLENGA